MNSATRLDELVPRPALKGNKMGKAWAGRRRDAVSAGQIGGGYTSRRSTLQWPSLGRPPAATFATSVRRPGVRRLGSAVPERYFESAKRKHAPGPGPEKRRAGHQRLRTNRRLARGLALGPSTSFGVRSTRQPRYQRSIGRGIRADRRQIRGAVLRQNEPQSPASPGSRSGIAQDP